MPVTIAVRDESTSGEAYAAGHLAFEREMVTVRELIRSRVFQDVKDHNVKRNQTRFSGLVQPTEAEQELNGYRLKHPRQVDWQKQYEVALESFAHNGFLVLVNDRQVDRLDEVVELTRDTTVTFLRLVPLVGG
ncbi:MAG: hypothetical protein H6816_12250 [Phycisphaerales bacterium]|nr:hypothetical protein [Phycisphaerales bacterium]